MKIIIENTYGIFEFDGIEDANKGLETGWQRRAFFNNDENGERYVCIKED